MTDFGECLRTINNRIGAMDNDFLNFRTIEEDVYIARSMALEAMLKNWIRYLDEDACRADDHYHQEKDDGEGQDEEDED